MPAVATAMKTGNAYIDGILGDVKWATANLTYSFPTSASYYGSGYGIGEPSDNFGTLNNQQQDAVRIALGMFSSVANLNYLELTETAVQHADLRFALSDAPSTAWAYLPHPAPEGGDAWFNNSSGYYSAPVRGDYAHFTIIHEIGHAHGLDHAHEDSVVPVSRDSIEYTVMSYRSFVGASTTSGYTNEPAGYSQSLMMFDIAALQHLYGANFNTNSGATIYSWSATTGEMFVNGVAQGRPAGNRVLLTIWDGGGSDTYDFSNYATNLSVDLRPGSWTTTSSAQLARLHYDGSHLAAGNIANALLFDADPRSLIENAVGGAGNDQILGNLAANSLRGAGGNDRLYGLEGNDYLEGGGGDDILIGGSGIDRIDGGLGNDYLIGQEGNDVLLDGAGTNTLQGGTGNDIYAVQSIADTVFEFADEGIDEVQTFLGRYTLPANVENLTFVGSTDHTGIGTAQSNRLIGGAGNDYLVGGDGNDVLIDGQGLNTLQGGRGNDIYAVQSRDDTITEFANEGTDQVQTFLAQYELRPHVEDLIFVGHTAHTGIGTSEDNRLTGASYNDHLTGGGGADIFDYRNAVNGYDVITDFDAADASSGHDQIDLTGRGLNFDDLTITAQGAGTMVSFGGDTISLLNVGITSVNGADFLFG